MLLYFSGTGNSLYAARVLAKALGTDDVRSIPHEMERLPQTYSDELIGLVVPIYAHEIPAMVQDFLARASFDTPYFFVVLTYGNRHANAVELACHHAQDAGIKVSYAATLLMVDNWLPGYDVKEQLAKDKDIDGQLQRICADVVARKQKIEPVDNADRAAHEEFLSLGISFKPQDLGGFLTITDDCNGCGACAQVCPAGCLVLDDTGRMSRDALAGLGCNACLACVHVCPVNAIEMSMGDKNPTARFRNEHVSFSDLRAANEQTRS